MITNYRKYYKAALVPLALLLMQSCFVAKVYKRPELKTDSLYRMDVKPVDSTSIADIPWHLFFTDTLLDGYIKEALTNNYDIRIAIQHINIAQAYLKQGKAANLPIVNGNLDYSALHPSKYGKNGDINKDVINEYDLTASLSWEADIWGKIRSQKRALAAQYLQSTAAHRAVKTALVASVASIYYQLLSLDKQAAIAKNSIENRKNSLEVTKALKKSGRNQVTAVAVKQAEAQVYDAQIILLNLHQNTKLLENTLSILLAEPPHAIARDSLDNENIDTSLHTGVPALLLKNRPDVQEAEQNLISAFELTNVAKASFYPSLTLTASTGLSSLELEHWFSLNAILGSVAAGLFQPILNGRQIRTQYETSLSQKQIALLNYKKVLLQAGKEVSDALENYQSATRAIDIEKKQVDALQQATHDSKQLLIYGLANFLEVLTSQQQALSAELQLVEFRYSRLNAIVTLYQALGGGSK